MRHPSESELALMAGGELGLFARLRVNRHLKGCPVCRAASRAFAEDRVWLSQCAGELPPGLNWGQLAAEMKANIHLGLEADRCAGVRRGRPAWSSHPTLALASAALIIVVGVWLSVPQPEILTADGGRGVTLEATPTGIELKQDDRSLMLLNPGSEPVAVSVSMQGALRARYVDSETGHVTITNVYAQ